MNKNEPKSGKIVFLLFRTTIHKDITDTLNLSEIAAEFISFYEDRRRYHLCSRIEFIFFEHFVNLLYTCHASYLGLLYILELEIFCPQT